MAEVADIPEGYTGLSFAVYSCSMHGAHLKMELRYEGDVVYTADLDSMDARTIETDLRAARTLAAAEVAAFMAERN